MTQPQPAEPAPEIVEWGDPRSRAGWLAGRYGGGRWRDPVVGWVLAGLALLALFGALVDVWQVTDVPAEVFSNQAEEVTAELPATGAWGSAWLIGAAVLAACLALTVVGLPVLRPAARSIGLAVAGVQAGLLLAMSIQLQRSSVLESLIGLSFGNESEFEVRLGRGIYLAYLGIALAAAGLWWVRPQHHRSGGTAPPPAEPAVAEPADLMVGPAEPFTPLRDDRTWR